MSCYFKAENTPSTCGYENPEKKKFSRMKLPIPESELKILKVSYRHLNLRFVVFEIFSNKVFSK